jgi:hypothetical protein
MRTSLLPFVMAALPAFGCAAQLANDNEVADDTNVAEGLVDATFVTPDALLALPLDPQWSCSAFPFKDDIWIDIAPKSGLGHSDFRIGAGGAISQARNVDKAAVTLLGPPLPDSITDRVIQWVAWSGNLKRPKVPAGQARFNLNQAGGRTKIAPALSHSIDTANCATEVYAAPRNQYFGANDEYFKATFRDYVKYQVIDRGMILAHRVVVLDEVTVNGTPTVLPDLSPFQTWVPLSTQFNAIATSFLETGAPATRFLASQLGHHHILSNRGYAVAYKSGAPATGLAAAVISGRALTCNFVGGACQQRGSTDIAISPFATVLAVNSEINISDPLPKNTVIEQYEVFAFRRGITADFVADIERVAPLVPSTRIYPPAADGSPSAEMPPDTDAIVTTILAGASTDGVVTDHLLAQ